MNDIVIQVATRTLRLLLILFASSLATDAYPQQAMLVPTVNESRPDGTGEARELWFIVQTGPAQAITDVDVSPDGQFVVNAGDATPRIWKLATGEVIRELTGHQLRTTVASFSNDGKLVLTGGYDSYVRLWDWRDGRLVRSFGPHLRKEGDTTSPGVQHTAMSADGKVVMTTNPAAENDSKIVLWDAEAGAEIRRFGESRSVTAAAMSSDASLVATGSHDGHIQLWNANTGRPLGALTGHSMQVNALEISPDNKLIASASGDRTARIWDLATEREVHLLAGHIDRVTDINFSRDGRSLVTCGDDGTVRQWNTRNGRLVRNFDRDVGKLAAVVFTPDAKQIITGGEDRSLYRLYVDAEHESQRLGGYTSELTSAAITSEPARLVTASPNACRIWDLHVGCQIDHFGFDHPRLVMSASGRFVVTIDEEPTLQLHDLLSRGEPRKIPNPETLLGERHLVLVFR